jgi:hypothetical protein
VTLPFCAYTDEALRGTAFLVGVSLIVQTIEFLKLRRAMMAGGVWAFDLQHGDFVPAPQAFIALMAFLSRDSIYLFHLALRLIAAVLLIALGAAWPLVAFLLIGHIVLLMRWRGAFNGGSDFMTLVVLSGLLIAHFAPEAGLLYIAIQASASYLVSGGVKLLHRDWRSGKALLLFLDDSLMGPLADNSAFRKPLIAKLASYAFILWESAIPLAFLSPLIMLLYCGAGIVFHFLVFRYFGLNRFFFAWIACYPALLYAAALFHA